MKTNLTWIVMVLDKSGSMSSIKSDVIGSFNTFINEQKKVEGEASASLLLFDSKMNQVYENVNIKEIQKLNESTYVPSNCTALYDAIGTSLKSTKEKIKILSDEQKPESVIFVIITDGMENSSHIYNKEYVFNKIKKREEKDSWKFIYMGANQSAYAEGGKIGIKKFNTVTYTPDSNGIKVAFASANTYTTNYRNSKDKANFNQDLNQIYKEEESK